MTLFKVKEDLNRRIADVMARGGFQARPEWSLTRGNIKCGVPDHEGWHFEVHVLLDAEGAAVVGIKRSEDQMRDGQPWDSRKRRAIPDRSFNFRPGEDRETHRFFRALKAEVEELAARFDKTEDSRAVDGLSITLQDMIARDPESAGEAIAAILGGKFDRHQIEALRELVEEANAEACKP